jgi:hypothetical protein
LKEEFEAVDRLDQSSNVNPSDRKKLLRDAVRKRTGKVERPDGGHEIV